MDYLGDTVTIIRHFSGTGKMGNSARKILEGVDTGENRLFISSISLVEILYLSEKKRIQIHLQEVIELIGRSTNYHVVDLNPQIIILSETLKFRDIFDRLIMVRTLTPNFFPTDSSLLFFTFVFSPNTER